MNTTPKKCVEKPAWLFFAVIFLLAFQVSPGSAQTKETAQRKTVKTVKVRENPSPNSVFGMGSISCPHACDLGFDDTGVLSEVLVEEGDEVQAGQVLAKLDASVLTAEKGTNEAKLVAAIAEAKFFQNELGKKEKLYEKNAVSESDLNKATLELERAKASVDLARAELATIQVRLDKRILRAPISGIISKRDVDVGSVIMPGSNKVYSLIQCRKVHAEIELGEKMISFAKPGMPVKITVDALEGRQFSGKLVRVSPQIDKKNRTFVLKVEIDNTHGALKPGMFVRAETAPSGETQSVWISKASLRSSGVDRQYVFVVKDGFALRREVKTGKVSGEKVEVVNGLTAGDIVVVEGQDRISDMDEVAAMPDNVRENE